MDTVQQDAFAMKELLDEGGEGLTGLARALMLVTARLKYVAESEWGSRRYLDVTLLEE